MKKELLEHIKLTLTDFLKQCYHDSGIYISIRVHGLYTITTLVGCERTDLSPEMSSEDYCIEAIPPEGNVLKVSGTNFNVDQVKEIVRNLISHINNFKTERLQKNPLYKPIRDTDRTAVQKSHIHNSVSFMEDSKVLALIKEYHLYFLNNLFPFVPTTIRTYCLQFKEWKLTLNSKGDFIYDMNQDMSMRTDVVLKKLSVQFSAHSIDLVSATPEGLFYNITSKFLYKIDILKNGLYDESINISQKSHSLIFDFDSFGAILHEGVGHAFEFVGPKYPAAYQVGEILECNNVSIFDSGRYSEWVFVAYDDFGNPRFPIELIKNGQVEQLLTGITGAIHGHKWNYCDRREQSKDLPLARMSCLKMSFSSIEDYHSKSFSSLHELICLLNNPFDMLFIIGSKQSSYDITFQTVTIKPEMICYYNEGKIHFKECEFITFQAKLAINNITNGYGIESERYNFCTKKHQTISTACILNQFIETNNFIQSSFKE